MSATTRKVRQPGRTAQGHNKPDCGVCNNGAPGPISLTVNGMGSPCCIEPFDNGGTAIPLTADAGNCARSNSATGPYFCSYTYPMTFAGSNFEWAVSIECISDGAGGYHVHVGVSLIEFVGGGSTATIASGDWYSSSFAACGNFDCTFPGGGPGGTLSFDNPGMWCTPGSCGTITWGLNTGNVTPCPQPAAKNCCCGGQSQSCFCAQISDPTRCGTATIGVALCNSGGGLTWSGDDGSVSAVLEYHPEGITPVWRFTWTCSGGTGTYDFQETNTAEWYRSGSFLVLHKDTPNWIINITAQSDNCVWCGGGCTTYSSTMYVVISATGTFLDGTWLVSSVIKDGFACEWHVTLPDGGLLKLVVFGLTFTINAASPGSPHTYAYEWSDTTSFTPVPCANLTSAAPKGLAAEPGTPGFASFYGIP